MRKNIEVATYYTKTNNKQKINVGLILLLHLLVIFELYIRFVKGEKNSEKNNL